MVGRRLTVQDAADTLGISANAVRMRVRRGSLSSEKDKKGRVWVLVNPDERASVSGQHATDQSTNKIVEELRDRIKFVEGQLKAEREAHSEARRIIAGLVQRVPELEPRQQSEDAAQKPPEKAGGAEDRVKPEKRSWWRRIVGG